MNTSSPILIYDGECNFCDASVRFILKNEKDREIKFTHLNSSAGTALKERYAIPSEIDSLIFIENNELYLRSRALFKIIEHLRKSFLIFKIFSILPTRFLDFLYDSFAKNRYRWFGKDDCIIPSPELLKRFI